MTDICEFCGKSFSNIYNLNIHTKSAKYCLAQRNEKPSITYPCKYCDSQFTKKSTLNNHLKSCVALKAELSTVIEKKDADMEIEKRDKENKKLYKENAKLKKMLLEQNNISNIRQKIIKNQRKTITEQQSKIIELEKEVSYGKGIVVGIEKAPKPQMIMNNTNSNGGNKITKKKLSLIPITHIQPLTDEYVKSRVEEYDYNKYKNGRKGVTQFIENLILLDMDDGTTQKNMVCTDRSRNAFHRLVQNKEWKSDAGATYLNTILNSITDQVLVHDQTLQNEIDLITDEIKLNRRNNNNNDIVNNKRDKLIKFSESLRPIYTGITVPKSKDRTDLFESIRNDIRDKCAITTEG
jgi:hypothetical protein